MVIPTQGREGSLRCGVRAGQPSSRCPL